MTLAQDISLSNPVAQVEHTHLNRALPVRRPLFERGMVLINTLLITWAVGMILAVVIHVASSTQSNMYRIPSGMQQMVIWLAVITLIGHFRTIFRTSVIASDTVLREKMSGTWETLILTDVGTRQLVLGKWWAVVCMVWRSYALLALLRTAAVLGVGSMIFSSPANVVFRYSETPSDIPLLNLIVAGVLIVMFTMLNCLFTAASGVVGSFLGRKSSPGVTTAIATRGTAMTIPILLLLIPIIVLLIKYEPPIFLDQFGPVPIVAIWTLVNLVDNGTLHASMLANPLDSVDGIFYGALLLSMFIYVILTLILLRFGMFIAHRQGVLS